MGDNNDVIIDQNKIDIVAKTATATAMALSTNYCLERKGLYNITEGNDFLSLYKRLEGNTNLGNINWIKIKQIGRPISTDSRSCFSALQNILQSCCLPKFKTLFLITGEKGRYSLYIGIQGDGGISKKNCKSFAKEIDSFLNISWPGTETIVLDNVDENIKGFINKTHDKVYAVTGIPSMDLEKTAYPSTIEYLLGGCQDKSSISYLVVADPVSEDEINDILYKCDEIKGQIDSFKSFTLSDSVQHTISSSATETISNSISQSVSDGTQEKSLWPIAKAVLGVGIGLTAAAVFPPTAPFVATLGVGALAETAGSGIVSMMGLGFLVPTKTHSETITEQSTTGHSTTNGVSDSYSQTMGTTIVNGHIESLSNQIKKQSDRFSTGKAKGLWKTGCYLFTDKRNISSQLQLKSLLSGDSSQLEPIRIHDISKFCCIDESDDDDEKVVSFLTPPDLSIVHTGGNVSFEHPFGEGFSKLTTYLTTEELTSMINFPLHSVPGINVADCPPAFSLDLRENKNYGELRIGQLVHNGRKTSIPCTLDMDILSRHSLICGVNGSGKTNTVLAILDEMKQKEKPFLIIEPAKTEYVEWALRHNEEETDPKKKIRIFMPGCTQYSYKSKDGNKKRSSIEQLKVNPFEVISFGNNEPRVLSHIDRLKTTLAAEFPMQDILPLVVEHLLYKLYGLDENDSFEKESYPTLSEINRILINNLMDDLGYGKENTMNIAAAIRTRFASLKQGWKGQLLNNERISLDIAGETQDYSWNELFRSPVVINLSYAGDDKDRAFLMSLFLQFLYEYRIAESEANMVSFDSNVCRHLVVVEEAHRVMMQCENPEMPQFQAAQMFSNFLSEVRAYGQGMMIVDQVPTRLIDDAIKNTNLKIVHKLVASDDAERLAQCMGLTEEQQKFISKLSLGQAIISGLGSTRVSSRGCQDVYLTQIDKKKNNI